MQKMWAVFEIEMHAGLFPSDPNKSTSFALPRHMFCPWRDNRKSVNVYEEAESKELRF